jgi:hypothetical protein
MSIRRSDSTDRVTDMPKPKLRVGRGKDGELELTPDQKAEDVHPETIAAEKPDVADDPRTPFEKNVGGNYYG